MALTPHLTTVLVLFASLTSIAARCGTPQTTQPIPDSATPRVAPTSMTPPPTVQPSTAPPTNTIVFGFDATSPSSGWTKPAVGQVTTDPVYGTTIRRMTSADGTRFNRNTYSRRQAENASGTLFMTYHGDAEYHVYDQATLALVAELPIHPDGEPQWHPTDPNRVRHIAGPNASTGELRYYEYNISSGTNTVIADLTIRIQAIYPTAAYLLDRAEGSPSMDGNRLMWIVADRDEEHIAVVSYDLSSDTILGLAPIETDAGPLDWVSASATGSYVLAGYWDATYSYRPDLTGRQTINDEAAHSDTALSADGRDVYVYIDFSAGQDGGWLVSVDLATNHRTRLFDLYDDALTSVHVSGKGYNKPGWVVVSSYNCRDTGSWPCEKVMAVELGGSHRIANLAHTYNCGDDYWTETHAVVNRDFTRVYFNSDGGSCGIDAEVYQIAIPPFD